MAQQLLVSNIHCLNVRSAEPPLRHLMLKLWLLSSIFANVQVLLEEGPTTYSLGDLRDATKLAQKIVQSYGMTDMGITMHAPKQRALGFMKRSFEVSLIPGVQSGLGWWTWAFSELLLGTRQLG